MGRPFVSKDFDGCKDLCFFTRDVFTSSQTYGTRRPDGRPRPPHHSAQLVVYSVSVSPSSAMLGYQKNSGGHLNQRHLLVSGDEKINSLPLPPRLPPLMVKQLESIASNAAVAIAAGKHHAEPLLAGELLSATRRAASAMLTGQSSSGALLNVLGIVEELRKALARATGRPLSETGELQIVSYNPGGGYHRHVDYKEGMPIGPSGRQTVRRSLSFLIYLTPDDWNPAADGGALRVYNPSSPPQSSAGHIDVQPLAGTLVVFDSSCTPHEVLTTRRQRMLLAGWLHTDIVTS